MSDDYFDRLLKGAEQHFGKIILSYGYPPIPIRYDWVAYVDGREEDGPCGYGATKLEALSELLDRLEEEEES
jgi:hypothetical protein